MIGAFRSSKFGFLALETWNVLVPVWVSERGRERDILCLCCAFSAVLSGFGHSLPCEACRENVSHGVIMTNPPPHTQSPFSSSIFLPITWRPCLFFPQYAHKTESRISCLLCVIEPWQHRGHLDKCDWIQFFMWLFFSDCLSGDCHVYLSQFPVSVRAVESFWFAQLSAVL